VPVERSTLAELQFLVDNDNWHVCNLSDHVKTAKENMAHIVQAEAWMQEHCEPNAAFRFGGTFYFKNQEDHLQFTLMWA
jgi:hypothetical protein